MDLEVLSDIRSKFLSGKSESSDVSDVTWYFRSWWAALERALERAKERVKVDFVVSRVSAVFFQSSFSRKMTLFDQNQPFFEQEKINLFASADLKSVLWTLADPLKVDLTPWRLQIHARIPIFWGSILRTTCLTAIFSLMTSQSPTADHFSKMVARSNSAVTNSKSTTTKLRRHVKSEPVSTKLIQVCFNFYWS